MISRAVRHPWLFGVAVMMVWVFWMCPYVTLAVSLLPADERALLSDEAGAELYC